MQKLIKIFFYVNLVIFFGLTPVAQAQKPIIKFYYPPKGEKIYTAYISYYDDLLQVNTKDTTVFLKLPRIVYPYYEVAKRDYFIFFAPGGTGGGTTEVVFYLDKLNYKVFYLVFDIDTAYNLFAVVEWNKVKVVDYLKDTCIFYRTVAINDPEDYGIFPWNVLDYVKLSNGYLYIKFRDQHRDYRTKQFQGKDLYIFRVIKTSEK